MADEIKTPEKTEKQKAIQAYHDAATPEAKAEAVEKYPVLKTLFAHINHAKSVVGLLVMFFALAANGQTLFIGSPATVSPGTTNTGWFAIGSVPMPINTYQIYSGGIPTTNTFSGTLQIGFDGTNGIPVSIYWPSSTNAHTDVFNPAASNVTIYARWVITTTNAVQLSGTYK